MLLLFLLLCYSWAREILSGHSVAEARAARIGATRPRRAATRSTIIHGWSRGRALSQCTLVEGSLAGTALEAEVGGLSGDWGFAVGGRAGGVGIVGVVVMMRKIAVVAHRSEGKKADMVVSMQGPLCDAGSALASCRVSQGRYRPSLGRRGELPLPIPYTLQRHLGSLPYLCNR